MCKSWGKIGRAPGVRAELSPRREFDPRQIHFFFKYILSFFSQKGGKFKITFFKQQSQNYHEWSIFQYSIVDK